MTKSQRDSIVSRLSDEDRQDMRRVIGAIKEARKGSPDLSDNGDRIAAQELLDECQDELAEGVRRALQAILTRDEAGPRVGEIAPDFSLKKLGSDERVRLSGYRSQRPVALAFGSYT